MHSCTLDGMITPEHTHPLSYGNTDRGLDGRKTVVVLGASCPNQRKLQTFLRAQLPPLPWGSLCWSWMDVSRSPSFVERPCSQRLGENATPLAEDRKEVGVGVGTAGRSPGPQAQSVVGGNAGISGGCILGRLPLPDPPEPVTWIRAALGRQIPKRPEHNM